LIPRTFLCPDLAEQLFLWNRSTWSPLPPSRVPTSLPQPRSFPSSLAMSLRNSPFLFFPLLTLLLSVCVVVFFGEEPSTAFGPFGLASFSDALSDCFQLCLWVTKFRAHASCLRCLPFVVDLFSLIPVVRWTRGLLCCPVMSCFPGPSFAVPGFHPTTPLCCGQPWFQFPVCAFPLAFFRQEAIASLFFLSPSFFLFFFFLFCPPGAH